MGNLQFLEMFFPLISRLPLFLGFLLPFLATFIVFFEPSSFAFLNPGFPKEVTLSSFYDLLISG